LIPLDVLSILDLHRDGNGKIFQPGETGPPDLHAGWWLKTRVCPKNEKLFSFDLTPVLLLLYVASKDAFRGKVSAYCFAAMKGGGRGVNTTQ